MSLVAITAVDFLPADFHAKRRRQRIRRGRWAIVAAFLALTGAGLAGNQVQHAQLRAHSHRLRDQAAAVVDVKKSLASLNQQIELANLQADVRSRLRLRPATTRLIAGATSVLPKEVTLQEIEVRSELPANSFRAPRPTKKESGELPPEQIDLERLLSDQSRQIVTVRGLAPTDAMISSYLVRLRQGGMFDEVSLLFTDRYDRNGSERRTFSVRLRVRQTVPAIAVGDALGGGAS